MLGNECFEEECTPVCTWGDHFGRSHHEPTTASISALKLSRAAAANDQLLLGADIADLTSAIDS